MGKNTTQKLSLVSVSNTGDKENNRFSRNCSKEKLHLTTLHSNVPPVSINGMAGVENIPSERDVFWNISITNQSHISNNKDSDQEHLKESVSMLETQLGNAFSAL